MRRRSATALLLVLQLTVSTCEQLAQFTCGECSAMQEAIQRSIVANITSFEVKGVAGTTQTATIEVGQIIWHLCGSDAWTTRRHKGSLTQACKREVRKHVDLMTNYWKEKSSDEYKDKALALRMKRAVCPNQDVGACDLETLPSDYEPLRADECTVCRAMSSDLFGMVRQSRDKPTSGKSDAYFRLVGLMQGVCEDMPMRHPMRPEQRQNILELCEDLWDEYEAPFSRIALKRTADYASTLCSEELELCEDATTLEELYAHDPSAQGQPEEKEEL